MGVAATRVVQACGPENARATTLILTISKSQKTCRFSQVAGDCSVLNILRRKLDGVRGNFLKNVLLMKIKTERFSDNSHCICRNLVRAEMKQFDSFRTSIRLRFFQEAVYTQAQLSSFTAQATLIKAHGAKSTRCAIQLIREKHDVNIAPGFRFLLISISVPATAPPKRILAIIGQGTASPPSPDSRNDPR
jgi:hypothetical protein